MHTHLSYRLKRRPVEQWLYEEGREQGRGAGNDGLGGMALGALVLAVPVDQEGPEEEENHYLKFHKCRDSGEVYGAAYLINKEHLLEQFTFYNLTWVNCEMGSFIMMNQVSLSLNFRGVIYGAITLYWWCLVLCGALDSSGILLSCPSIPLA